MKQENKEIKKNEEMINELNEENLNKVSGGILAFQAQFDRVSHKLPVSEEDEEPSGLKGLKAFKNPM